MIQQANWPKKAIAKQLRSVMDFGLLLQTCKTGQHGETETLPADLLGSPGPSKQQGIKPE